MADDNTDGIIGLLGAIVFAVCTIVVPFLKMTGFGFITESETILGITTKSDFFFDRLILEVAGIEMLNLEFSEFTGSNVQIIWDIAALWQFVFLGLGLIGFLLVALPAFQKLAGMDPMNVSFYGFLAGLVATLVHYLLIVGGVFLDEAFEGGIENINIIVLGLMVIGWIGLFVGYKKASA